MLPKPSARASGTALASLLATACQSPPPAAVIVETPLLAPTQADAAATPAPAEPPGPATTSTPAEPTAESVTKPPTQAGPQAPPSAEIMKGLELATLCVGDPKDAAWVRAATWPPEEQPRKETPSTCYLPWSEGESSLGFAYPAGGSIHVDVIDMSGCAMSPPAPELLTRMQSTDVLMVRVAHGPSGLPLLSIRVRPLLGVASAGFSPEGWGPWRTVVRRWRMAEPVWTLPFERLVGDAPHRIQMEFTLWNGPGGVERRQIVDMDWPVSC